jgi:hypothetical protein
VYLADGEGWRYAEIAKHEQRSVASVRTSLMRGRVAFKARARELAEERGMWPLSVVLFPSLRRRYLAWRAPKDADRVASVFSFAQAAAAAFAVLTTVAPSAAAAAPTHVAPRTVATASAMARARRSLRLRFGRFRSRARSMKTGEPCFASGSLASQILARTPAS